MNLQNKVVVITGANGGIGRCVVALLKQYGAQIVGTYWSDNTDLDSNVKYYKVDVADYEQCANMIEEVIAVYKRIDVLINAAGITQDALVANMTSESFDAVISVNLKGTWNMCQLVGPIMQEAGSGSIINVGSVVGRYGNIGQSNYAASKAGLIGMSKSLAKEFSRKGAAVRVNVISPGYTKTHMLEGVPEELLKKFADMTMLHRLAEPEEIANAIMFLADDMSSYITGTVLEVDGGMRL